MQVGKLQPIQLILAGVLLPLGGVSVDWWALGDLAQSCENSRIHPKPFPCPPNRTDRSAEEKPRIPALHTLTHPAEYAQTSPEAD